MADQSLSMTNAEYVGARLSMHIPRGTFVVTYFDQKNDRIVLNIYPGSAQNTARIQRQIKMFSARVFEHGQRLDDSVFTGA